MKIEHNVNDEFERNLPQTGQIDAVCCDLYDKGIVTHPKYGERERFLLGFQIGEIHPHFKQPYLLWREYTKSLHPDSNFRQDLEKWRGQPLDEDADGNLVFDAEDLVGARCTLVLKESPDGKYVNITGVFPPRKTNKLKISKEYVRKDEREALRESDKALASSVANGDGFDFEPDDDLPF